jgi:hypothetical protein
VVGYAISRLMEARIAVAALKSAIRTRLPPRGCIRHSDRGSRYASDAYRALLAEHGLKGWMSRRGNPYDNAKAESFMKALKVEAVYLVAYGTFEDVTAAVSVKQVAARSLQRLSYSTWPFCLPLMSGHPTDAEDATVLTAGKVRCSPSSPCSRCCAWLRVALLLPSPPLRAVTGALPGRDGKAGTPIEPDSWICDTAAWTTVLRSGLSVTAVTGVQFRVCRLQRRGLRSRAL